MTRAVIITSKQLLAIVLSPDTGEVLLALTSEDAPVNVDVPVGVPVGVPDGDPDDDPDCVE